MFTHKKEIAGIPLPCGRCRACRIARSREWYTRLWHENTYWEDAIFATFTYDDEHLIECGIDLNKQDFQQLVKRTREIIYPRKIKYYGCGEYGDREYLLQQNPGSYPLIFKGRPHYHLIIFGMKISEHKTMPMNDGRRVVDGPLKTAWNDKGMVVLGSVTKDSLRYVTDYIQKKLYGKAALLDSRTQPFSLMSQGIGRQFAIDNAENYYHNLSQRVLGTLTGMPRYYVKQLGLQDKLKLAGQANALVKSVEDYEKHGIKAGFINAQLRETKELALKQKEKLYGRQEI